MGLKDDIHDKIDEIMKTSYETTNGNKIPDRNSLTFGNTAKKIWVRAMFIDLRNSRELLSENTTLISAKIHKSFLYLVTKCIRNRNGEVRSFNGDGILAFFYGDGSDVAKNAVKAAMNIKSIIHHKLNPILENKIEKKLDYGIGIAQGPIFVVKSGIGGDENTQDLIWIGKPTYLAVEFGNKAKSPYNTWISKNVFNAIKEEDRYKLSDGKNMWVYEDVKTFIGEQRSYQTTYMWNL